VRRDRGLDQAKDEVTDSRGPDRRGVHPEERSRRTDSSGQARLVGLAVVVGVVSFAAFLPALGADFVSWDDERNFLTNPHYRGLGLEQLRWMWTTTLLGHYVPLSWLTLGADYALWGMSPRGYHLTNLLFHAANGVLVFLVARDVFGATRARGDGDANVDLAAAFAALAFAAHPLRVESVAWVTERRDVVSLFFCLLTVLTYLRATRGDRLRRGPFAAAVLFFVCALLSKGTSVSIPAVLLILNFYPLRRIGPGGWWGASARRAYLEVVPFAVPAVGFVALSIIALHPPDQLPLGGKLAVSAYSLVFYLVKTVLPAKLSPLYSMPVKVDPLASRFLPAYVGVVVLGGGILLAMKSRPGLAASLLAFIAITLPMLGIVQNGPQIAADRYTYHAGPALALLFGGIWVGLRRRTSLSTAGSIGAAVILLLATLTWRQTTFWTSSTRLWARVLEIEPDSPLGNSAWAALLFKQNRVDEAIEYSVRAVRAAPGFAEGHNDLGVGLARKGQLAEAIERYRVSLSLKPSFDEAENNWGAVLAGVGQLDSAVAHYRRALAANPENPDAEVNWGNVLVRQGRTVEAIEHYRRALWIRPDHADAHHNWGVALARDGRLADAVTHFQSALSIDTMHAEAREYLLRATQLLRDRPPRP
jgi:protein O-mannosyl-transferase